MRTWAAVFGVILVASCRGGFVRVPDRALTGLPTEGRRWIFDAENAVVAALDGVDIALEGVREADEQRMRAERSLRAAEQRRKSIGTDLGVVAARSRLTWAQLGQQLARERLELARDKVRKARADLELDKARLVVAYDLVATRGFRLQPFEEQALAAARRVEARQRQVEALARKLQQQEEQMQQAQRRYIAQTGDHDSGVWLD
ncbi:MAG: hypothetical protein RMK29_04500 [Myxococcales bacterium]|nr:hypothetical protein [Myxococcota bacterium]MDW8280949.1 hypothetical protein [Myxococcales bacterium]